MLLPDQKSSSYQSKVAEADAFRRVAFLSVVVSTVAIAGCGITLPWLLDFVQLVESQLADEMDHCMMQTSDLWRLYADTASQRGIDGVLERTRRNAADNGEWRFGRFYPSESADNADKAEVRRFSNSRLRNEDRFTNGIWSFGRFVDRNRQNQIEIEPQRRHATGGRQPQQQPNNWPASTRSSFQQANSNIFNPGFGINGHLQQPRNFRQTAGANNFCCTCHQGPAGPAGPPGNPGRDGRDGNVGQMGVMGFDAPPGAEPKLPEDCNTCAPALAGPTGPAGQRGPKGFPGDPGDDARDAPAVFDGPRGDRGPSGPRGSPGQNGPRGENGRIIPTNDAPRGGPGVPGRDGGQGDRGSDGRPGQPGYIGAAGPRGDGGASGAPGQRGYDGGVGDNGPRGLPGDCTHCPPARFPPGYFYAN